MAQHSLQDNDCSVTHNSACGHNRHELHTRGTENDPQLYKLDGSDNPSPMFNHFCLRTFKVLPKQLAFTPPFVLLMIPCQIS